jgi:hypothetical protein
MAKGQITEEQLSSGLKGLGSFATLGTARPLRDSPFRDSRSEVKLVEIARAQEAAPAITSVEATTAKPVVDKACSEVKQETRAEQVSKRVRGAPKLSQPQEAKAGGKAAILTERVTLQMSPEMRDEIDSLARGLQRSKTTKEERITSNTVMRVAIRRFLEEFSLPRGEQPNSEEELLAFVMRKRT